MRPLSHAACDVLREPRPRAGELVFPSTRGDGRMTGFRKLWDRIAKQGELPADVTPHVLRHVRLPCRRSWLLRADHRRADRSQGTDDHQPIHPLRRCRAAGRSRCDCHADHRPDGRPGSGISGDTVSGVGCGVTMDDRISFPPHAVSEWRFVPPSPDHYDVLMKEFCKAKAHADQGGDPLEAAELSVFAVIEFIRSSRLADIAGLHVPLSQLATAIHDVLQGAKPAMLFDRNNSGGDQEPQTGRPGGPVAGRNRCACERAHEKGLPSRTRLLPSARQIMWAT